MTSGQSRYADAAPAAGPDLLDTGRPTRPWPWLAVAALVVVALVWWNVGGSEPEPAPPEAAPSEPTVPSDGTQLFLPTPDRAEFLTYADEQTGFLVQWICSEFSPEGNCPRQLLATDDGGQTWEVRGRLPEDARYLDRFVLVSATVLAFVGDFLPAVMAVSYDAGRTFTMRELTRGPSLPAPPGAPVVTDPGARCTDCPTSLSWVDVTGQSVHGLPSQPGAEGPGWLRAAPRPSDGDLVVAGPSATAGWVWMSRNGGMSWVQARLEVPDVAGQAIQDVTALAAGGGRAYAFVEVYDATGVADIYGFRTGDAGRTWAATGFQGQSLWRPAGVLGGELISTNNPGTVFLSSGGGQNWAQGGSLPAPAYLSQTVPDGPVLATLVGQNGLQTYYQSTDGRVWTLAPVPPPPR